MKKTDKHRVTDDQQGDSRQHWRLVVPNWNPRDGWSLQPPSFAQWVLFIGFVVWLAFVLMAEFVAPLLHTV